ncbi:phospho-sugar mutase [Yaniella halotolerans]|uniref:phospho-sugar mutase n=1 Tax=Yaniella halotolerans TaxID=225453 RepID=UPI0003B4A503|nr:phospho-sugar mutase [Yaniella halotolerans]
MDEFLTTAQHWMDLDPEHAEILAKEISAARREEDWAIAALTARFAGFLTFGTAGLRAPVGPGTTRMNRIVVQRAAAGIADFAHERADEPVVVIGYDARHRSRDFAVDSAAVFTAAGCRVQLMPTTTPTPILAYALKHLAADIGIMVTASHNPPADNGYKVYLGPRLLPPEDSTGAYAQITSPTDELIAAKIHAWNISSDQPELAGSGWELLSEDISTDYVEAVRHFLSNVSSSKDRHALNVVYTPMHGVGAGVFCQLMDATGFNTVSVVDQQVDPDPAFPTVAFPNPEEPGALDLAISTADSLRDTDLIIAHDPDADRLAAAVLVAGEWRRLSGDHVGLLLGARLMPYLAANNLSISNSVVSAPQLAQLASHYGVPHQATPTGFKWICRAPDLGFGYEEALGYAVAPHLVNDKDGLSAAVILADLAAELKAQGTDLVGYLQELTEQVGPTITDQISVPVPSPSVGSLLVDDLRKNPPLKLAQQSPVIAVDYANSQVDLAQRYGPMNMVEFSTEGLVTARLMIRPSGTEPKVKCYISVSATPGTPFETVQAAMVDLREEAANLVNIE